MKTILTLLIAIVTLGGCKESGEKPEQFSLKSEPGPELTTAHKIANRYGLENWDAIGEIQFTFNVDRDDRHMDRSFSWKPKSNDIIYISGNDTLIYNRESSLDSLELLADKRFINDSYWLLAPFKLVWDEGTSFTESSNAIAPVSKDTLNMLTILYGDEGGYTPGDAYDFYFDKDLTIKEWAYRGGNREIPSIITTWSENREFGGILLSTVRQDSTKSFKISFSNISVKK